MNTLNFSKILLSVAAAFAVAPSVAHAETLSSTMQAALQNNPKVTRAGIDVEISKTQTAQAQAQKRGRLDAVAGMGLNEYDGYSSVAPRGLMRPRNAGLNFALPLYTGGRLEHAIDAAKRGEDASLAAQENDRQQVLLTAGAAFLNVAHAQDLLHLAEGQRALLQKELAQANAELKAGIRTKTDVAQAQARLSGAQAAVDQAGATLQEALANFEASAGRPFEGDSTHPDLTFVQPSKDYVGSVLSSNPLIRATRQRVRQAQENFSSIKAESRPTVTLTAGVSSDRDTNPVLARQSSQSIGLQVSVPLYTGGMLTARNAEASLNARAAQTEEDSLVLEIKAQAVGAWESYRGTVARVYSLNDQVTAAEIAVVGARQEAKVGTRTLLDVLNAEQELLDARVAMMGAEYDKAALVLRLRALAGQLRAN